ncbi:LOW QUALITY PROTEIN: hypothetical protein RJ639_007967 [Escallonia herrerae]|uniref:Reverse transcriptase/retrotransposon-derived protein RNase H-like domain-containing protein n=1 Tax=Escallonia herrerae TaxID=1293975 RepID=A0AA89AXE3_9ASTE|nr:LOW QUALITY PROTEIN: hypothetical protein RJ639_007967 [Escallonia herrerae]
MAGHDINAGTSGVTEENVVVEHGRDPLPPAGGKKGGHGQSKSRDAIASLEGCTCVLEEAMDDVKDRLGFVEQNLQTLEDHVLEELESLKKAMTGQDELRTRFMELFANLQEQLDVVKVGVEETRQEMAMCKRAIAGGAVVTPRWTRQKPKEFGDKRDAKELDNFIWHRERYFEGASITDDKAKGYSAKAAPLIDLLKKGKTLEWSKRCQTTFEGLKEVMTEEPILALPDHTKVFELQTDASDFAIGGVLMQEGHLIAFESRKLNDTERRYTVQEKEMTAQIVNITLGGADSAFRKLEDVVSSVLAKGFVLGKDAINKAKSLDEKHQCVSLLNCLLFELKIP